MSAKVCPSATENRGSCNGHTCNNELRFSVPSFSITASTSFISYQSGWILLLGRPWVLKKLREVWLDLELPNQQVFLSERRVQSWEEGREEVWV
jgi:hypothetical protein